jgi:predicted nucleic acid-binding protein
MKVVLDTSAVIAVLLNEPSKYALLDRTEDSELLAPYSLPVEVGNAFSAMFRRNRLSLRQARIALSMFRGLPIHLLEIDLTKSLELSHDLGIYAYDAYIIECARRHKGVILTLDAGLVDASRRANVDVVEI